MKTFKQPKVYVTEAGEVLVLKERVRLNVRDRIYVFEGKLDAKKPPIVAETTMSPADLGLKCLGAL